LPHGYISHRHQKAAGFVDIDPIHHPKGTTMKPQFLPLGVDGVLIRFAAQFCAQAQADVARAHAAILAAKLTGVTEVTPSLVSLRVGFALGQTDRARLIQQLRRILADAPPLADTPHRLWRIPVGFGPDYAPDLPQAAALAGITQAQAVADITGTTLRVLAIGFAPGQPYLGLLPPAWQIARQTQLTPQMPQGALVTAVRQLIIFAATAPTGWRQIGQTGFAVYRPDRDPAFAFAPGDAVQFVAVSDDTLRDLRANPDSNGGADCQRLA
jgi:KipI family sensor histidine kinase inhibitor